MSHLSHAANVAYVVYTVATITTAPKTGTQTAAVRPVSISAASAMPARSAAMLKMLATSSSRQAAYRNQRG